MKRQLSEHQVEPNSSLGKALNYMLNRWDKLTAFCRIENAPLDNNNVEAMLKIAIRTRKNAMFYKTNNGAYIAGMMMSLIETCRVNVINPTLYLNYLQENVEDVAKHPQKYHLGATNKAKLNGVRTHRSPRALKFDLPWIALL